MGLSLFLPRFACLSLLTLLLPSLFALFLALFSPTLSAPLWREDTIHWLRTGLRMIPSRMRKMEASISWLCYWLLHALDLLGALQSLPRRQLESTVDFIISLQHPTGGFCGSIGQSPHILSTYAALLALCTAATALGPEAVPQALSRVDRAGLRSFLERMRLPPGDENYGSFRVCDGGETDTRAVFGAVTSAAIMDVLRDDWDDASPLSTPASAAAAAAAASASAAGALPVLPPGASCSLVDGTVEWLARCQTHEGGIAGEPGNEAHGGYGFCAFAVLLMLRAPAAIDTDALLRWAAFRQMAYEGGFSGRTNKLVDSCYSFWVGVLFPLIHEVKTEAAAAAAAAATTEASLEPSGADGAATGAEKALAARAALRAAACARVAPAAEHGWLFDQRALQTYLLSCCQELVPGPGLRDKPGVGADYYHTCYALHGMSIAQHSCAPAASDAAAGAAGASAGAGANADEDEQDEGEEHDGAFYATVNAERLSDFASGFPSSTTTAAAASGGAGAGAGAALLATVSPLLVGSPSSLLQPMHRIYAISDAAVAAVFGHWAQQARAAGSVVEVIDE